jgi:SAM-dependent methyltransferase
MRLLRGRRGVQTRVPGLRTMPGTMYRAAGERYLKLFIELGHLQPDNAVLEPGCGTGRMARPLTGYLSAEGSYDGFDVVPDVVETCIKEIGSDHPNFRFQHVDVHNGDYNFKGSLDPTSFAFPYADESFDFVFLTSVFTHMLPPDVRHYMDEIRRVLRQGGRSLMTFLLLNSESLAAIEAGKTNRKFRHQGEGYRYDIAARPEAAVAYPEDGALLLIEDAGLVLDGPVHYGRWTGREPAAAGQDVVVVKRPG